MFTIKHKSVLHIYPSLPECEKWLQRPETIQGIPEPTRARSQGQDNLKEEQSTEQVL